MFRFSSASMIFACSVLSIAAACCCLCCRRQSLPPPLAVKGTTAPTLPDAKVYGALLDKALAGIRGRVILQKDSVQLDMSHVSFSFLYPGPGAGATASPEWAPSQAAPLNKQEWKQASDSLRQRNIRTGALPALDGVKSVSVATTSEINQAFAKGWHSFYEKFPGATGLLSLSRPGYSSDGHVALVAIEVARGMRSAEQDLVVLKLGAKGWTVIRAVIVAVA